MDDLRNLNGGQNPVLVALAFLQADSNVRNVEYGKELFSLGRDITRDTNCNGPWINAVDDEDLETDGHLPSSITISLEGIEPSVDLHRNREEAAAIQRVAEELRGIAAELEHNVVAQATQNLRTNLFAAPFDHWSRHLNREVERLMRGGMGLEHLPQERVIVALTLTLVKGVCQQAPQLLRGLFYTALQYITSFSRAR